MVLPFVCSSCKEEWEGGVCNSILFTLYRDILQIEQGFTFYAELNEVRSIKRLPFFQAQSGPFKFVFEC